MERIFIAETTKRVGERVRVAGWVHSRRDHGKLIFIDLRDRSGILQVVFRVPAEASAKEGPETTSGGDPKRLRAEWVITVEGEVKVRPEALANPGLATGTVELVAQTLMIIAEAETPPFEIADEKAMESVSEDARLCYRYLDLRRPEMLRRLAKRHEAIRFIRNFLSDRDFLEIETPILTKSTPEGARDYLVPSRLHRGSFYALPQSPQQYKQLLMVAGIERYFQIARCFRDEDTRGDRQPEFTQLDLEMSFVEQDDILALIEDLFASLVRDLFPHKRITETPWPRLDYDDVMARYGTDRPDLRKNPEDADELAFTWILNFPLFERERTPDGHFAPSHHMFTAPKPEDVEKLDTDPGSVRSLQHDLVLNGWEVGGGSIRIHDPQLQQRIFSLIGFTPQQEQYFSHMLTAFRYGAPPHGGIAPGIDRILMILLNQPNIREVIAFPKTGDGRDAMMDAPSFVSDEQIKELGLRIEPSER